MKTKLGKGLIKGLKDAIKFEKGKKKLRTSFVQTPLKVYMCAMDPTDIALGAIDVIVYPTIAALKKKRTCWKECGIIEIEIKPKLVLRGTNEY